MEVIFDIQQINETAAQVLPIIEKHKTIAIHGNMGAGKTTFVGALCKALNVMNHTSSPTFSIINNYQTVDGRTVFHIDLYRLKNTAEVIQTGVEDCLYSNNICFVEWPELAKDILPPNTLHIFIEEIGNNKRKLKINL